MTTPIEIFSPGKLANIFVVEKRADDSKIITDAFKEVRISYNTQYK